MKLAALLLILLIIFLTTAHIYLLSTQKQAENIKYGVHFSPNFAKYLGLDWKKTYISILDDLKVRNLRLPTFWKVIENNEGVYDFSEPDFLISEASKREGTRVLLVVGVRQPRWPECHAPKWVLERSVKERQDKALEFIKRTVNRYKDNDVIWAWQVENEPLLGTFGDSCDKVDLEFLKKEVELVKKLDPKRPIVLTDSGELRLGIEAAQLADVAGTTIYRKVHDNRFGPLVYPYSPYLYSLKSKIIKNLYKTKAQKTIVTELQTEPWVPKGMIETPIDLQTDSFSEQDFKNNVEFASKTGFDEIYLWGVEWWYFAKQKGYPEYLNYAKNLFKNF